LLGTLIAWAVAVALSPVPYPLPNVLVWLFAGLALEDYLLRDEREPRRDVPITPDAEIVASSL
jgi:hypothetical protein